MNLATYRALVESLNFGKRLPSTLYIARPTDWSVIPTALTAMVERAASAALPDRSWNLLKFHLDQFAITFLSYPGFDSDPHPPLAEATKINLGSGSVLRTDYRGRPNPPILHRKETFLQPEDPRKGTFATLTTEEEMAGLYRDPTRIGLRVQWNALLSRKGISYDGHRLRKKEVNAGNCVETQIPDQSVERHRTAIKRYDISKPVKLTLDRNILAKGHSFFDYGCGHGMDIDALICLGFQATGWDPAFRPDAAKREADIVNVGYVLNVIEEPKERIETLRSAFALAKHAMVVATMVTGQETASHTRHFRDGFLTKTNTFQKFYAPGELEALIEETLDVEAITISLGICVAFKNPEDAEEFESSSNRRKIDWDRICANLAFSSPHSSERRRANRYDLYQELFDEFWQCVVKLGRPPEPSEFPRLTEVRRAAGGINRALNLVVQKHGETVWNRARQTAREDVIVYLALTNFRRKFLRREIPLRIKNDIKAFFGDLNHAQTNARDLLFAAGDPGELEIAVEDLNFGHFDRNEEQFTFHRSLLDKLPPVLRVYVLCAAVRFGNPNEADLIKIHVRSGKLTFLHYDDFDGKVAPILMTRIKINLRNQFVQVFDHSNENQALSDKSPFF